MAATIAMAIALLLAAPQIQFIGRAVTVMAGERDPQDEMFPKGPASVCIEGPPEKQCYTAPEAYGNNPTVEVIQIQKGELALLFSADSGGVSGWEVHFALLEPGAGKILNDLFIAAVTLSNQSEHAVWNEAAISDAPIFMTADVVWVPDESHFGEHRYMVSAYARKPSSIAGGPSYFLEDRYMTVRRYDLHAKADVLASERPEIIARLRRLKVAESRRAAH